MADKTLAVLIADRVQARINCRESGNQEWLGKHGDVILALVRRYMPHGSGIDNGATSDIGASTATRLVFHTSYHHMDQNGFYDGWTEHVVRVTPTFGGIDVTVGGRNRNDIKDYLADMFRDALERAIPQADYEKLCIEVNGEPAKAV